MAFFYLTFGVCNFCLVFYLVKVLNMCRRFFFLLIPSPFSSGCLKTQFLVVLIIIFPTVRPDDVVILKQAYCSILCDFGFIFFLREGPDNNSLYSVFVNVLRV